MAKIIKWGILGLGKIAHKFASDLAKVQDVELYAVASRNALKSKEFKAQYKATKAYSSYEDLAKDTSIDAVYIATPHAFHKPHTILCLQHKKAVLCEKPFAMNLQEVEEMIACAKENNVLLMEALWTYFLPHYQFVIELVKSNKYGKLKELKADFGFYTAYNTESRVFKKEVGGGSLLDIGIYPIFAALSTLGKPECINANATFFENGADSSCDISFNYKNAKAELYSTLLAETPTEAIFTFEKAMVTIHTRFHEPTTVSIVIDNTIDTKDFNYKTIGYFYEIEHFNQLLREEKIESNLMTFEFSKTLIATLDKVRTIISLEY